MAVTLAQSLLLLQNKGKWIKGGKKPYTHERVESFKQLVASVRDRCDFQSSILQKLGD